MSDEKKYFSRGTKGQMFLIGAVIIVTLLVLIRTSVNVSEVLEKKKFLEAGLEKTEFANIRSEVPKSAYNAVNYSQNMTNVTNAFIAFAEDKLAERTMQLDGVSVNSAYANLTASTDTPLNVTFYNFFDLEIPRAVVNLSTNFGSPVTFNNTQAGATKATSFTLNLASSQNLTLWIYYEIAGERVVQNVTIPAEIGKTKFVGYFDLRMAGERGTIRDRFSESVSVN